MNESKDIKEIMAPQKMNENQSRIGLVQSYCVNSIMKKGSKTNEIKASSQLPSTSKWKTRSEGKKSNIVIVDAFSTRDSSKSVSEKQSNKRVLTDASTSNKEVSCHTVDGKLPKASLTSSIMKSSCSKPQFLLKNNSVSLYKNEVENVKNVQSAMSSRFSNKASIPSVFLVKTPESKNSTGRNSQTRTSKSFRDSTSFLSKETANTDTTRTDGMTPSQGGFFMNCKDSLCVMRRKVNLMNIEGFPKFRVPLNLKYLRSYATEETQQNQLVRFQNPVHSVLSKSSCNQSGTYFRAKNLLSCLKKNTEEINQVPQEVAFKSKIEDPYCILDLSSTCEIKMFNPFREDKKLLVLDLNQTLGSFPHWPKVEDISVKRPHLEEFLASAYNYFDIAIWSSNPIKMVLKKLEVLNILSHSEFKIAFCLDTTSLLEVNIPKYGFTYVKPLELIWSMFNQFNHTNTLIVDDQVKNFHFNPQQGILVNAYYIKYYDKDQDLKLLSDYLRKLVKNKSKWSGDHTNWKSNLLSK